MKSGVEYYLRVEDWTGVVYQATSQKHLDIIFDNRLSFEEHLTLVLSKINKTIGMLRKLQSIPRSDLFSINKTFVRPHLDYGGILVLDYRICSA